MQDQYLCTSDMDIQGKQLITVFCSGSLLRGIAV